MIVQVCKVSSAGTNTISILSVNAPLGTTTQRGTPLYALSQTHAMPGAFMSRKSHWSGG
jgi:hypothetical protein